MPNSLFSRNTRSTKAPRWASRSWRSFAARTSSPAEELLRRPEMYSSKTAASSEGGKLLQAITRRPEPRWVPLLLLKMWKEIPAARGSDSSIFRDALLAHASLFPNATRRQLAALGIDDEIRKLGEADRWGVTADYGRRFRS